MKESGRKTPSRTTEELCPFPTTALNPKFQKERPIPCPSLLRVSTFFTYLAASFRSPNKHISLQKNTLRPFVPFVRFVVNSLCPIFFPSVPTISISPSQIPAITFFTVTSALQVTAFTIFTPKNISRSILPRGKIPPSVNKSTQVPAITNSNQLKRGNSAALHTARILHFRRKYLISSLFFVTELETATSR